MWALGLIPAMPPYDSRFTPEIMKQGGIVDKAAFINSARLRADKEIDTARQTVELWNWRSRTRQLQEQKYPYTPTEPMKKAGMNTLEDVIRITAQTAGNDGLLPPPISDDFPARGKAYRDLTADEWSEVRSIAMERHFTLNWLCGHAPGSQWDSTPTGT